jgi:ligand-binding SRPBCC domain-containing protein
MNEFLFSDKLWLPRPIDEIFAFFGEARNLEILTPPWLKFEVVTPAPIEMRPGTLIDYRIRVHHTHTFTAQNGGTLCRDDVRYYPIGGTLINALFVRNDVTRIFVFRKQKLQDLFGKEP